MVKQIRTTTPFRDTNGILASFSPSGRPPPLSRVMRRGICLRCPDGVPHGTQRAQGHRSVLLPKPRQHHAEQPHSPLRVQLCSVQ